MKKRFWGLILITVCSLVLGVSMLFAGCDNTASGEKADYSVTVYSPAEEPLSDITVSWITGSSTGGSAKTDAEGKATASLPAGTYSIALAGYGEGLEYDSASVSSTMRNVTLQLSVMKVNYTVSVKDKTGAPAANVSVSWTKDGKITGTANTGADGKAAKELDYGEYSVTLSNIPEGNIYDGAKTVSGKNPAADFELRSGETKTYSVKVLSEGGLIFKEQSLFVDKGVTQVTSGWTDENGVFTFTAEPDDYTVSPAAIPEGYSYEPLNLTADVTEGELVLHSEVITSAPITGQRYVMGDIIHNYSFTTPYELNGSVWSKTVAEILADKEVLLINNWGTGCTFCVQEMPAMQEIYEKYSNKIEIVAVSNYTNPIDTDSAIINYYAKNGYTFPMMRDTNGFSTKFGLSAWPTTVVVDRYGAIARIEVGAVTSSEVFERLILKYIGDDYVQSFVPGESESESINNEIAKPDVEIEADHYEKIAKAMNGTGVNIKWFGETEYEYAWPFVLGTVEGVSPDEAVMYSSNTGKANSMSIIYATVTIDAGKVFTFDYYSDTEEEVDVLYFYWDGKIIKEIHGNSKGWQTCYLYTDLISGEHSFSMTYRKDNSINRGKDNVYLRNVRYTDISDITDSTDMLRGAAYGTPAEGASEFPYYVETELKPDGYYHVKLGSLENKQYAGNDESPLLLVNLLSSTAWFRSYSIYDLAVAINADTKDYLIDCTFTINGVKRDYRKDLIEYCKAANGSEVPDFVPVDSLLHDLLVEFIKKVDQSAGWSNHEDEWLEACYFYSHYGSGSPIGNPILGLMKGSAIPVTEGTYTADLTRVTSTFPTMIYSFTPTESAVYKIESLIPEDDAKNYRAQAWLYDDDTDPDHALVYCGDTHMTRDESTEHNFEVYRYMKAGEKYYIEVAFQQQQTTLGALDFKISKVGQSVTVLTQCSTDEYFMILDEADNIIGTTLAGAVDYVKDEDGYYHSKNPDGTTGDFIYLDVTNAASGALGTVKGLVPLNELVDWYVTNPPYYQDPKNNFKDLDYKMFDFRYCVFYFNEYNSEGKVVSTNYDPKVDISEIDSKYKDYTEILRAYIESAPTEGEYAGLIKVNQELVDILTLYVELRVNGIYDNKIESALENEWLRFCWYNRTYNENNP